MALNTNTPNTELENMQPAEAVTTDEQVVTTSEQNDVTEPTEVEAPAAEEQAEETVEETVAEITIDKVGNVEIKGNENYETTVTVSEDGSVEIKADKITEEKTEEGIKIDFRPEEFVNNLGYMGKGMLGIFVVIGAIIGAVYLLGLIGKKKNKQQ